MNGGLWWYLPVVNGGKGGSSPITYRGWGSKFHGASFNRTWLWLAALSCGTFTTGIWQFMGAGRLDWGFAMANIRCGEINGEIFHQDPSRRGLHIVWNRFLRTVYSPTSKVSASNWDKWDWNVSPFDTFQFVGYKLSQTLRLVSREKGWTP